MDILAIPGSPTGQRAVIFRTDRGRSRLIRTPARPAGLRIIEPFEAAVWATSLPAAVQRHGKTIFRVAQFVAEGFVIEEQAPGIQVRGEVSYSDLPPPRTPPEPPRAQHGPGAQESGTA